MSDEDSDGIKAFKENVAQLHRFEKSAKELAGNIAVMVHSYFQRLMDQGFERPEALLLAKDYQTLVFANMAQLAREQKRQEGDERGTS